MVEGHRAWRRRGIASDGSRRMAGHNLKPDPLPEQPAGKLNLTDPDSRNLKTPRGFLQGYNAQALVGADQIIVAAETSTEAVDSPNLEPMVEAACAELRAVGIEERPGVLLADAGYWQADAIEAVVQRGIQTLIPPDGDRRAGPRPGREGGRYEFARRGWQAIGARRSTGDGRGRSSRSSGRSRPIEGSGASNVGAD